MTKRKTRKPDPNTAPSITGKKAIELLQKQLDSGNEYLLSGQLPENEYAAWETLTQNYLIMAFGSSSPNVRRVMDIGKYGSFPINASETWRENHRVESITKQTRIIESLLELLQVELDADDLDDSTDIETPVTNRVFLVHGHNEAILHEIARFLEALDLEIVALREQPNQGRTIIEKFLEYSDVSFAVVLLTADDKGGAIDAEDEQQQYRARQNVIFELGFFIGKLGRRRVCALYQEGVEIPSDYHGVLFVPIDTSGGWRLAVAKELKAAGLQIDMNRAV